MPPQPTNALQIFCWLGAQGDRGPTNALRASVPGRHSSSPYDQYDSSSFLLLISRARGTRARRAWVARGTILVQSIPSAFPGGR